MMFNDPSNPNWIMEGLAGFFVMQSYHTLFFTLYLAKGTHETEDEKGKMYVLMHDLVNGTWHKSSSIHITIMLTQAIYWLLELVNWQLWGPVFCYFVSTTGLVAALSLKTRPNCPTYCNLRPTSLVFNFSFRIMAANIPLSEVKSLSGRCLQH